jgi:5-methylcytosine-specific restriction protein B
MIPANIKKEHIDKAIKEIDKTGIRKGRHSSTYNLVYQGKSYPPKLVVSIANRYANGVELDGKDFDGGPGTEAFKLLEKFDFQITEKANSNVVNDFEKYLSKFHKNKSTSSEYLKMMPKIEEWLINSNICSSDFNIWKDVSKIDKINNSLKLKYADDWKELNKNAKNWYSAPWNKWVDFNLMTKSVIFSWVKTHNQLSKYLLTKESQQQELIQLLKTSGVTGFKDQDENDKQIELDEIDPFTFFSYIYKYGNEKRLKTLQKIAKSLNLSIPQDDSGIPSTQAIRVHLFPWKKDRTTEIQRLWALFRSVLNKNISDDEFEDILNIFGVGDTKLTEILFYVDPENHFPINGPTKPYLEEVLNIDPNFNSFSEYKKILEQIRNKTDEPFYKLSYTARLWSDSYEDEDSLNFIEFLNGFSKKDLNIYFPFLFHVLDKFNLKKGDERLLFSTKRNRISFVIGQRYSWALFKSNVEGKFVVLSEKELSSKSKPFSGNAPYPYHTHLNEINFSKKDEESIFNGFEQELKRTNKTGFKKHNNEDFENAVFDQSFREQFIKTEIMESNKTVLNKILFGPPGTGKTYNMINEALNILDPKYYLENQDKRVLLNKRFKELLIKNWDNTKGQIAFCTFHQSFSYEDFVEGIKPKTNDKKEVYYEIEDGIFKKICQLANSSVSAAKMNNEGKLSWDAAKFEQSSFYKLSLGESNNINDSLIYEYCRDNNVVSVGFGDDTNFSDMTEDEISRKCEELDLSVGTAQRLNYFIHDLKNGNYVIVSNGNRYIRCLGKVIGDYEYVEDSPIDYHHFRKVEWIFVDENIPVEEVYDTNFNQKTIYKLDKNRLKKEFFVNYAHKVENESKKVKDYILIIDEINRGNVSSIFGELITLIEPDKRAGKVEELEVTLPYSKEPFKVPHNVYIVGTMNTADRSIEALDTALRRRFSFVEKPPVPELIRNEGKSGKVNGIVNGINLQKVLETINKRIEKLIDKDHKIGHSYFLKVNDKESLINCFENEVIPLLEEYFFGDYGKIGLVLGDSFVAKDQTENFEFAEFAGYDADVSSDLKERSVYKIKPSKNWDFNSI